MGQQKARRSPTNKARKSEDQYARFDKLNGSHPWQTQMPENCLLYPVRELPGGKVAWFNFELAREMGLIPESHPSKMTKKLSKKLLETFCIRIINEYDEENNIVYPPKTIKRKKYMATRYLQLQHADKTGKTSGDGRCVWNGTVRHKGLIWDVSSRGTGVTTLAPGAVQAGEHLESGNTDFGYGCGLAEIDELYGSAIMSEIMHHNSIRTERMLAIIDIGDGCAIGVRAEKNLFRPAHLFMYLKQENHSALKKATDFLIDRQHNNGEWGFSVRYKSRYRMMLNEVCESFAQFAAQLEREYIFAWLDWDGDNVLATAGIIDYGSVRQFGLRHDQYRYDDDDRFSTNLNEQKAKAKLTVQVFAQLVDFLKTREKRPLAEFKSDPILDKFEQYHQYYLKDHLLYQMGFTKKQREFLLDKHGKDVEDFSINFTHLEKMKTKNKLAKVADGVNRPAILNMRSFLREYPVYLWENREKSVPILKEREVFHWILSQEAPSRDSHMGQRLKERLHDLQRQYVRLLNNCSSLGEISELTENLMNRSQVINREDRVTGNALINIVNEIMKSRENGISDLDLQKLMDDFIHSQFMRPELVDPDEYKKLHHSLKQKKLGRVFLTLVDGYKEDI